MENSYGKFHGRGSKENPKNRFNLVSIQLDPDQEQALEKNHNLRTVFLKDTSRSIISHNDSPDVGFDYSINPYRGCEHGCTYCYARPTHEYLGLSSGLDFESKIFIKEKAPELLRKQLASPNWEPRVLTMSGVTDPYQPVERRLRITRQCLEVLVEFRNPVIIITKNHLITRDIDLLSELTQYCAAEVILSITSLNNKLTCVMEPRASQPKRRLDALSSLAKAKIPVGVLLAPIILGLNDHEIPSIISAVANAGAKFASYTIIRLPYANKLLFDAWLTEYFPDRKEKILNRIRMIRGGKLNESSFGSRMKGEGLFADQISSIFTAACKKAGLTRSHTNLSTNSFKGSLNIQPELFKRTTGERVNKEGSSPN